MNYKYLAVGALLAGLCLAPAVQAAVTDVSGGETVVEYKFKTDVRGEGDVGVKHYYTREDGSSGYDIVWHEFDRTTGFLEGDIADPGVQGAIIQMRNDLKAWAKSVAGRSGVSFDHSGSDNHFSVTEGIVDAYYTSSQAVSTGAILVGDQDNMAHAYAAEGNSTMTVNVNQVYEINLYGLTSPIVLDLDGDGTLMASDGQYKPHAQTFKSEGAVMFDFHGNGFPVATEWVGPNDGLLCRPQADERINGTHLFGTANGYSNGYEAMAALDKDQSGALEGQELEGLFVWQDLNGNGRSDEGELKAVQELGITSISVNHTDMSSTYVRNGQTLKSFDWWPSIRDVRRVDVSNLK